MKSSTQQLRDHFRDILGTETVRALHKENAALDAFAIVALVAAAGCLCWQLGTRTPDWLWLLCLVAQGQLLMVFGLAAHDFLHRGVGTRYVGSALPAMLMTPLLRSATEFQVAHARHHAHLGLLEDTEQFKLNIDTSWRRLVYATVYGTLFPRLAFPRRAGVAPGVPLDTSAFHRRIAMEKAAVRVFLIGVAVLACFWPRYVVFGYALPLVLVTPVSNSVRTAIEHSEYDAANPFQIGCFYRTNALTRALFFWDSGDCHFVHHVYPGIPYYRISTALRLMRPEFLKQGVKVRTSLLVLVVEWFACRRPYRSPNRLPAAGRA